jgi:hypothetical protein
LAEQPFSWLNNRHTVHVFLDIGVLCTFSIIFQQQQFFAKAGGIQYDDMADGTAYTSQYKPSPLSPSSTAREAAALGRFSTVFSLCVSEAHPFPPSAPIYRVSLINKDDNQRCHLPHSTLSCEGD